jgi:hypothetical protein
MKEQLKQSLLAEYPEWHDQPLRLTVSEIEDPRSVLSFFFMRYNLQNMRSCLKEFLHDALCADGVDAPSHVSIHQDIERLVEAAWLLHQQHKNEKHQAIDSDTSSPGVVELSEEWKIINEFFMDYDLKNVSEDLWQTTKLAITNSSEEIDASQISDIILLFEKTKELYHAVEALLKMQKIQIKTSSISS